MIFLDQKKEDEIIFTFTRPVGFAAGNKMEHLSAIFFDSYIIYAHYVIIE